MKKVSVIVLVYKSEPYIAATIYSVLAQTTLSTLVAAHLLLLLPQKLYNRIETSVVKTIGTIQRMKN